MCEAVTACHRVPEVVKAKITELGLVPSTSVALNSNGLPTTISLDWAHPEHVHEGAPPPAPATPAAAAVQVCHLTCVTQ